MVKTRTSLPILVENGRGCSADHWQQEQQQPQNFRPNIHTQVLVETMDSVCIWLEDHEQFILPDLTPSK